MDVSILQFVLLLAYLILFRATVMLSITSDNRLFPSVSELKAVFNVLPTCIKLGHQSHKLFFCHDM